jgi:hypothetical protein
VGHSEEDRAQAKVLDEKAPGEWIQLHVHCTLFFDHWVATRCGHWVATQFEVENHYIAILATATQWLSTSGQPVVAGKVATHV